MTAETLPCSCGCHLDMSTPELRECAPCCAAIPAPITPGVIVNGPIPTEFIKGPAGDHDTPYTYPKPTAMWPRPFSSSEFARLLILRGKVRAEREQT